MPDNFSRYLDLRQLARKLEKDHDQWYGLVLDLMDGAWWELRPAQRKLLGGDPYAH